MMTLGTEVFGGEVEQGGIDPVVLLGRATLAATGTLVTTVTGVANLGNGAGAVLAVGNRIAFGSATLVSTGSSVAAHGARAESSGPVAMVGRASIQISLGFRMDKVVGLSLWVEADMLSLENGDNISTLTSWNGAHVLAQAGAGTAPTFVGSHWSIPNRPAIEFHGGKHLAETSAASVVGTGDFDIFFVVDNPGTEGVDEFFFAEVLAGGQGETRATLVQPATQAVEGRIVRS